MSLFPTEQWLTEYERCLAESDVLSGLVASVGSPGDVLLVVEDLPLQANTVGDLPSVVHEDIPQQVMTGMADLTLAEAVTVIGPRIRTHLPDITSDLLRQFEVHVVDGSVYVHVAIADGRAPDLRIVSDPADRPDDATVIRGTCATWERIIAGRPPLSAVLTGDLLIDAGPRTLLRYGVVFQMLGVIAAEVETTPIFAPTEPSLTDRVLDWIVGWLVTLQLAVQRRVVPTPSAHEQS